MARTYGWLKGGNSGGDTQAVTRSGHKYVTSTLQNKDDVKVTTDVWHDGRVRVEMSDGLFIERRADGSFNIYVNNHHIATGDASKMRAFLGLDITHYNAAGGGGEFDPKGELIDAVLEAVDDYRRG